METKKTNSTQLCYLLFCIGFIVLLANKFARIIEILTNTILSTNFVYLVGICFVILSILIRRFSLVDLLLIGYGYFTFITVQDTTLFSFLVLIIAVQNINMDDVIRVYARFQVIVLSVCIVLYPILLAIGSSYVSFSYISGRSQVRYNFFFSHPNNFAIQCVFTVLACLYIKRKTMSYWKVNIVLLLTIVFLSVFPRSQTAVIALIMYIVVQFTVKYAKLLWKPFIKTVLPIIIVSVSILVYINYKGITSPVANYITGTFASRFSGSAMAFHLYKINLFGNYLGELGKLQYINGQWATLWIDLAYIRMLIAFGIVGASIFYFIFFRGLKRYIQEKNYNILSLLVVVMVYAISEWTAFSVLTVFPLLFFDISFQRKSRISIYRTMRIKVG